MNLIFENGLTMIHHVHYYYITERGFLTALLFNTCINNRNTEQNIIFVIVNIFNA